MYCKNCGQQIDSNATICNRCGAPIGEKRTDAPFQSSESSKKKPQSEARNKILTVLAKLPVGFLSWFTLVFVFGTVGTALSLPESGVLGGLLYLFLVVAAPIVIPVLLLRKNYEKKPFYQKWLFWLICCIASIIVIAVTSDPVERPEETTPPTVAEPVASTVLPTEEIITEPETEIPTETEPAATTAPEETTEPAPAIQIYGEGMYKVGSDIDAGEYFVSRTSGFSAYVEVSSDSSGKFESIVANANVPTFCFITVQDGQYISVRNGELVKAEYATVPEADENGVRGEGMYRVGIDIPAGEYKVTHTDGHSAYIEVNSDSSGTFWSIVANENVETWSYITVEEGQYFTVKNGEFSPA